MKQENEKLISGEETQPEEPMTPGGNSRALPFIPIIRPDDPIDPGDPEDPDEPEETAIIGGDFVKNGADMQESFGVNSSFNFNLYKGKLFFTQQLFTAEGLHLPASFSATYNNRFADTDYVHGQTTMFKGWKLNYQQFIRFADNKCVYVDGAFKEHIFEKSTNDANVYLDTSTRSGAILKPVSGGYEIIDGANTTLLFQNNRYVALDSFLRLKKEYQIGSDVKSYTYDSCGNVISTFVGGVIESSTFSTDGQRLIASPNHITEDSQTEYTYDGTGILSSMQLPEGQSILFSYQNRNILNRVSANVGGVINENTITYDGAFITNVTHNDTIDEFLLNNKFIRTINIVRTMNKLHILQVQIFNFFHTNLLLAALLFKLLFEKLTQLIV